MKLHYLLQRLTRLCKKQWSVTTKSLGPSHSKIFTPLKSIFDLNWPQLWDRVTKKPPPMPNARVAKVTWVKVAGLGKSTYSSNAQNLVPSSK